MHSRLPCTEAENFLTSCFSSWQVRQSSLLWAGAGAQSASPSPTPASQPRQPIAASYFSPRSARILGSLSSMARMVWQAPQSCETTRPSWALWPSS